MIQRYLGSEHSGDYVIAVDWSQSTDITMQTPTSTQRPRTLILTPESISLKCKWSSPVWKGNSVNSGLSLKHHIWVLSNPCLIGAVRDTLVSYTGLVAPWWHVCLSLLQSEFKSWLLLQLMPGFSSNATCGMSFTLYSQCLVSFPLGVFCHHQTDLKIVPPGTVSYGQLAWS